ncbi:MAG TPA: type IV pilus twitching motility protein PilT [Patescibacteria group bacterium]|nr:type IV pilus twitching motility protein PilT [Patescibacteria group bacterium]
MPENIDAQGMQKLLDAAIAARASDLHLVVGKPPFYRINGDLKEMPNTNVLAAKETEALVRATLRPDIARRMSEFKEADYSFSYGNMRFRGNAYFEKGAVAGAFRMIPSKIPTLEELGLPPILKRFTTLKQGFVIVTGPTGHGKSTTLASMINLINMTRSENIITVEDPIEYIFSHQKSTVSQRELGVDTHSFAWALKSALREDPNVILVGEMRDLDTIEAALTLAETGHLVLTTLHSNEAAQTPDRMIDVFPASKQTQVRLQLSNALSAIISQRLLPRIKGGRIPATEILIANSAVKSLIREGKTHQLASIMQTSAAEGMVSLDKVLADLVSKGEVALDDALMWVNDQKTFKTMVY